MALILFYPFNLDAVLILSFISFRSLSMTEMTSSVAVVFFSFLLLIRQTSYKINIEMRRIVLMSAAILAQIYYFLKTYLTKMKKKKPITLINTMQIITPAQLVNKFKNIKS